MLSQSPTRMMSVLKICSGAITAPRRRAYARVFADASFVAGADAEVAAIALAGAVPLPVAGDGAGPDDDPSVLGGG